MGVVRGGRGGGGGGVGDKERQGVLAVLDCGKEAKGRKGGLVQSALVLMVREGMSKGVSLDTAYGCFENFDDGLCNCLGIPRHFCPCFCQLKFKERSLLI